MKKHLETKSCEHFNSEYRGIGSIFCLDCQKEVALSRVVENLLKRLSWYLLPDESKKQ